MSAIQAITKQETQTAVTIKSVKIEKLFEIFDYDIEYADGENVLIITGPNGFGKTTILNILYNLYSKRFQFFYKLVFDRIIIEFSHKISIEIIKTVNDKEEVKELIFNFFHENELVEVESLDYLPILETIFEEAENGIHFTKVDTNRWRRRNLRNHRIFTLETLVDEFLDESTYIPNIQSNKIKEVLSEANVYLIKEQRLLKKMIALDDDGNDYTEREYFEETIEMCSWDLRSILNNSIKQSHNTSQELESTYTTRLISEKRKITKEEYNERFTNLQEKQNKLIKYGLYEKQATLEYSETDAKALLVYLNDLEKKLSIFDELLEKLDLFTKILNERRFTFKSIKINREKGFYFETSKGKNLQMNELSSGEQHEVVLLYELIFNTTSSTLVLVDEPETSLHITWQKEFVKDLLKIIKIQNFQVMIATHAPAIINDRWDLVYNLEKAV